MWGLQLLDPIIIVVMECSREPEKAQLLLKLLVDTLSSSLTDSLTQSHLSGIHVMRRLHLALC